MKKRNHKTKQTRWFLAKELIFAFLAITSIILVILEFTNTLNESQHRRLVEVDFVIACVFLLDFLIELIMSKNRKKYLRHNWFLLPASIPLTYKITEALRGLRALRLIRIVRAGEHLDYGLTNSKNSGK